METWETMETWEDGPITRPILTDFYRFLPIFRTFFLLPTFFLSRCASHLASLPSVLFTQVVYRVFTDFSDFLGRQYYFHVAVRTTTCFFSRIRPLEESDNKRSSARRGEFDSSTPGVIGVLLGQIFLARRFRVVLVEQSKPLPIKKWGQEASVSPEGATADFLPTRATIWIL